MNPWMNPEGENWWCQPKKSSPNIPEGASSLCSQNPSTRAKPPLGESPSNGVTGQGTSKLGLTDSQLLWLKRDTASLPPSVSLSTHSPAAAIAKPAAETDAPPAHMKGMLAAREHILQQLGIGRGSLKKPSSDHSTVFSSPGCRVSSTTHPVQALQSHVPEQAFQSHVPEQAFQSHVPEQAFQSHVPEQAFQSHVPEQAFQSHVPKQAWQSHVPERTSVSSQAGGSESNIYTAYVEGMYGGLAAAGGYAYPLNDGLPKPHQAKDRSRKLAQTPPKQSNGQAKDNYKTAEKLQQGRPGVKILGMESYQTYVEMKVEEEPKKLKQIPWREIKSDTCTDHVHVPNTVPSSVSKTGIEEERTCSKQGLEEGTSHASKYVPKEKAGNVGRQNLLCTDMHEQGNTQWKKTPSKGTPPVVENGVIEQGQLGSQKDPRMSSKPGSRSNSMSECPQVGAAQASLKVIKAEYDWRRFQLERKFKKVLDALKAGEEQVASKDLWTIIKSEGGRLAEFPMPGAEAVLFDLLLTQAVEKEDTRPMAVKLIAVFCNLYQKSLDILSAVLLKKQASYCKVSGATNSKRLYEGYSQVLGHLYLQATNNSSGQEFRDCICDLTLKTLEKWLHISTQDQEVVDVCTNCLCSLLRVVGSELDSSGRELMQLHFTTIKNKVLDERLPRVVRSSLLELALLRAGSWVEQTSSQENGNQNNTEDVVVAEAEAVLLGNATAEDKTETDREQPPPSTNGDIFEGSSPRDEEKDHYKAVRAMLTDLCLEEFLPKFQENGIRDATLRANRGELKTVLKESGLMPGTILEIMLYFDTHGW
ncbi:Hypp2254 [Branchiostoma lanceolatum]|uniref:Hypp2254 protein n=1 Tax=Branchiostoma lanceolatum TaxID=7740 RepID=A0A8J9ZPQ3_BRALA|nr:Hypp2254 [Branchiostoma lanceolatum]